MKSAAVRMAIARWVSLAVVFLAALGGTQLLAGAFRTTEVAHAACVPGGLMQRVYGYENSTLAAYGVDGFVSYTSGTLTQPACDKIAHFIGVLPVEANSWIQLGVRIGVYDSFGNYDATYKAYWERKSSCLGYTRISLGAPLGANTAYYVNYDGYAPVICGTQYEYAIRQGDWYNAPVAYTYLASASPTWYAQTEVGSTANPLSYEWTGVSKFGNPSTSLAYGLAWYNQPVNSWNEWTSATGATAGGQSPLARCVQVNYRAFKVVKPPESC